VLTMSQGSVGHTPMPMSRLKATQPHSRMQPGSPVFPEGVRFPVDPLDGASGVTMEYTIEQNQDQAKKDETSVIYFFQKNIFPHLKFFGNKEVELAFSKRPATLCNVVMTGCNAWDRTDNQFWWGSVSKTVARTLCRLRSDRVQAI
jgi:hypothetical protein